MRAKKREEMGRRARETLRNGGVVWFSRPIAAALGITPREFRKLMNRAAGGDTDG